MAIYISPNQAKTLKNIGGLTSDIGITKDELDDLLFYCKQVINLRSNPDIIKQLSEDEFYDSRDRLAEAEEIIEDYDLKSKEGLHDDFYFTYFTDVDIRPNHYFKPDCDPYTYIFKNKAVDYATAKLFVGEDIKTYKVSKDTVLVLNDNGFNLQLPTNMIASLASEYSPIVGNAIVLKGKAINKSLK